MQSLYAITHSENDDIKKEEKFLKFSIQKLFDLYVLNLQLFVELHKLATKKIEIAKTKILATKEDLQPNKKFIKNRYLLHLVESQSLANYVNSHKIENWQAHDEFVKVVYEAMINSEIYKTYMASKEVSKEEDKNFIIDIFTEIIASNEKLADYFEDETISWADDIPFVNTWIVKTLEKLKLKEPFILGKLYKDEDDEQFVSELFTKTILKKEEYIKDVSRVTPNWDSDRIADVDMLLIQMAITEFLYFPSIPTKVTINEYIEIAKDYSTSKSGHFINGVLDKLSKIFLKANKLQKIGRGLL